jgi:hypothetical protein
MQRQFHGWRVWMYLLPVREFKCPHCFEVFLRPIEIIGRLPLVSSLFARSSPLKDAVSRSRKRSRRRSTASESVGGVSRGLARFGRKVNKVEEAGMSALLKLIYFLNPKRLFSRSTKRSRRSDRPEIEQRSE